jgi:phage tail-like protein
MSEASTVLNLDLEQPGVQALLDGVVLEGGTLRLATVPGAPQALTDDEIAAALSGPAGIGVASDGTVYLADSEGNRVLRLSSCGGETEEVGCLAHLLDRPRGLVVGPREALYVADSGHHRVLVVDLATEQVRSVWGQHDRFAGPVAGDLDGELNDPWDLAADALGRLYVVDHGNKRIQRYSADGRVDPGFWAGMAGARTRPREPERAVTALIDGEERLLVFDRSGAARSRLLVYDLDGGYNSRLTSSLRALLTAAAPRLFAVAPSALAASGSALHVVESVTGAVLSFDLDGRFLGVAQGYLGGAAALALDAEGRLLVTPAHGKPLRLAAGLTAADGTFRLGPFGAPEGQPVVWRRLSAATELPDGAHVRLFTRSTDDPAAAPPPLAEWDAVPADALDALVHSAAGRFLWIGGRLQSGPGGGPVVTGFRLAYGGEGWLRYLPALYSKAEPRAFLEPALSLLESALDDEERLIDGLARLFDPASAPAGWLEWLGGWVACERDGALAGEALRGAVAAAFARHGRRGTADGLRELVRLAIGIDVAIDEPGAAASVWQLGDEGGSLLGFGTGLAAVEADGAVLGTTAVLDRSNLLADDDRGAPTLAELANRFCVRAYASDLRPPGRQGLLQRIVERERPLGTEAHVCVIEPRLRVGAQATVGVDTIVGRAGTPLRLGEEGRLGADAALGAGRRQGLTVDRRARLGRVPPLT